MVNSRLFQQFVYWGVWLIIPLLWEIFIGIASAVVVFFNSFKKRGAEFDYYPRVTILIPVYNSQSTLKACLKSIVDQNYPVDCIEVFLIDNGSIDGSFDIFEEFQGSHHELRIWWFNSSQGKSKALNKGIFASSGKYIINIDSDGCLERNAIRNVVGRFEANPEVACLTGVVLTDPALIEVTVNPILKAIRLCELYEYTESFLIGRNYQSIFNSMYTLAGAFSCFRRETLIRTQMYNSETLGEDTHMTFQIKKQKGGKLLMCENAFFYVDPIENPDKIYTQRQRWQRAELEVASLFTSDHIGGIVDFITKPAVRKLISDHTLTFPRMMWFFGMIYLYFINYPLELLVGANLLMYAVYLLNSFIYLCVSSRYLHEQRNTRQYILRHWYICLLLPVYRFIIFWVRVAGIINSMKTESKWRTQTFSEEVRTVRKGIRDNTAGRLPVLEQLRRLINNS